MQGQHLFWKLGMAGNIFQLGLKKFGKIRNFFHLTLGERRVTSSNI